MIHLKVGGLYNNDFGEQIKVVRETPKKYYVSDVDYRGKLKEPYSVKKEDNIAEDYYRNLAFVGFEEVNDI